MLPEWGQIQRQRLFVIISDKEKGLYLMIPFYYILQLCIRCYSIQIVPPWHKLLPELPQRKHVKYRLALVGYFRDYQAYIPKNGRKKTCLHARQISNPHLCVIHDDPLLRLQWIEECERLGLTVNRCELVSFQSNSQCFVATTLR